MFQVRYRRRNFKDSSRPIVSVVWSTTLASLTQWGPVIKDVRASLVTKMVKSLPAVQETQIRSLGWEDPLEKGMANHSSILAWRIPWKSLVGYSQWVLKELDTAKQLTHTRINDVNHAILSKATFSLDMSYFQGPFYLVHVYFVWSGLLTSRHGILKR